MFIVPDKRGFHYVIRTTSPDPKIDVEAIAAFCRERDLTYFVTSALTGGNVQNAANHMLMTHATRCRRKGDQELIRLDRPANDNNPAVNKSPCAIGTAADTVSPRQRWRYCLKMESFCFVLVRIGAELNASPSLAEM
jgi:hypothetical protein